MPLSVMLSLKKIRIISIQLPKVVRGLGLMKLVHLKPKL
jgi:hypothetical protein